MTISTSPAATAGTTRLFYVDDSGVEATGWIVYSWVECAIPDWASAHQGHLDLRRKIYTQFAIPTSYELHSAPFIAGAGTPSTDLEWNRHKRHRSQVLTMALTYLADATELRVGTVYRHTEKRRREYAAEKADVYAELVGHLDTRLGAADEHGMLFMDGDGTDVSYARVHRRLRNDTRRIVEDPVFQASHQTYWIQLADIVAWSAYQHLQRDPRRGFAWDWYTTHLAPSDTNGGPIPV